MDFTSIFVEAGRDRHRKRAYYAQSDLLSSEPSKSLSKNHEDSLPPTPGLLTDRERSQDDTRLSADFNRIIDVSPSQEPDPPRVDPAPEPFRDDNRPPEHIALKEDFMNEVSPAAKLVLSNASQYVVDQPEGTEDNPVFGPYRYQSNNSTYRGQYSRGMRSGIGKQVTINGSLYLGGWVTDLKYGQGREVLADGELYEGSFVNGVREGEGLLVTTDGVEYAGDFRDGMMHGVGTQIFPDGGRYEGQFRGGVKSGKGFFEFADGGSYSGDFKNDMADGQGIFCDFFIFAFFPFLSQALIVFFPPFLSF